MAKEDVKANLSIKVSHQDMLDYTDGLYVDIADPAINGIDVHGLDESSHNLPARFTAVYDEIDRIDTELATKLDAVNLDTKADVAGDTFTGTVIFSALDEAVVIDGAAGTDRSIQALTDGTRRWEIQVASNEAEDGADAGSNFAISRYNDNGEFIGTALQIDRATGIVAVAGLQVGGGGIIVGEGIDIRVQNEEPTEDLKIGTVWIPPSGIDGGGSIPILPQSGLISWITASAAEVSGGAVVALPDQSGANNHASVSGIIYLDEAITPNGQRSALRNGVGSHVSLDPDLFSSYAAHVFLYVYLQESTTDVYGPIQLNNDETANTMTAYANGDFSSDGLGAVNEYAIVPAVPPLKNSWRILEFRADDLYYDAITRIDGGDLILNYSGLPFANGSRKLFTSGSNASNGVWRIADAIFYNRALSDVEASDVRDFLVTRNGPTGAVEDEHFAAVMALNPTQYLPFTNDILDYSGSGLHAANASAGVTIVGARDRSISPRICNVPMGYSPGWVTAQCPTWSTSGTAGLSWSWWNNLHRADLAGWRYAPEVMQFGDNVIVDFRYSNNTMTVNVDGVAAVSVPKINSAAVEHYVLTVENDIGYPSKLYLNGQLVASFTLPAFPSPSGIYVLGRPTAQTDLGGGTCSMQHIATFDNKVLSQAEVTALYNARTIPA